MFNFKEGQEYSFEGYKLIPVYDRRSGKETDNPRFFDPKKPKAKTCKNPTAVSIRTIKSIGYGKRHWLEFSSFDPEVLKEIQNLNLEIGDKINGYGQFRVSEGHTRNFDKVRIYEPLDINRHVGRPAKATEL